MEEKLKDLYEFIRDCIKENGFAPNVREMRDAIHVNSTSTIAYYLKKLEQLGYIERKKGQNRAIFLTGADDKARISKSHIVEMPYLGNIAGGEPILAEENALDVFCVSQNLFGTNQNIYMLKVVGDSMVEAGISDGDTIVVKSQNTAENGEIIVAKTIQGTTVKKFYRESTCYRLQPCNSSMVPFFTKDLQILGKVIACIKKF